MTLRTDIVRSATVTMTLLITLTFSSAVSNGEEIMSNVHPSNILPPIDQSLPCQIETATFALG